jgi:superfamily I DNA/RNA helicase
MTLAHRVAHLIVAGVSPERILLLTFTRRAAQEMIRRVDAIVRQAMASNAGRNATTVLPAGVLPWSGTFHAVANRLLRRYAANLGLDPGFSILDRGDAADVIDVARHELGLSKKSRRFPKKDTCLAIYSRCVNARQTLPDVLQEQFPWCADWEAELRELFRTYVARKQQSQVLDYDDLLLYWSHLLAEQEFATEIGSWFDHVLVDEYQDTNLVQAEILRVLKPQGHGVTVVGDDAQSIYSFRAAEVENILGFPEQFSPAARVISLQQNYRSTQTILDTANLLIAGSERQYQKNLFSARKDGAKPQYVTVEDGDAEAEYVVESILGNREMGMRLMDQAVLFRGSHHSDRLELELVRHVAEGLGMPMESWHIKSTSKAADGLYVYDTIQRLNDARFGDGDVKDVSRYIKQGPLGRVFSAEERHVLLIDEVDKADVEFPNDLLHELDEMRFHVLETGEEIVAKKRPVVIITSNNEKELPDAFLRLDRLTGSNFTSLKFGRWIIRSDYARRRCAE